jgi:hypothetical protein
MPESATTVRRLPFLSVPAWDISDEEISEWKQTPGLYFAAYTAECIRDGKYDNGQEIYPLESLIYKDISRGAVDQVMATLAERGMVRKSGSAWLAIAPGRLEPSIRRAVAVLLDHRTDLPPALATELDAWNRTLDAIATADGALPAREGARAERSAAVRAVRPPQSLRAAVTATATLTATAAG